MKALLARAIAVALLVTVGAAPARAQRGIDSETFHPALDSYGIFTVERADTGKQWDLGVKMMMDFAYEPLRLALRDPSTMMPIRRDMMDFAYTMHVGAHLAIWDYIELAFEAPVTAASYTAAYGDNADPTKPTGFYTGQPATNVGPPNAAPGDVRVALKARTPRLGPVGLALLVGGTIPFGDDSAFLGDRGFTFRPTGIIDVTIGRFTAAVNAGYILRSRTVVLDPLDVADGAMVKNTLIELKDEVTFSAGASVRVAKFMGVGAEMYGLIPVDLTKAPDGRTADSADNVLDILGGLQFFPGRDLTVALGGGAGLLDSRRHDAFRVFAGISWAPVEGGRPTAFGGLDSDGDGIPDAADLCPKEPEDKDGFDDDDGCPDVDNDQDGIPDVRDKCPNQPEDKDGFQDDDGCPDPDNDNDGIPDTADQCPNEPEDKDGFQDDDGCPDPDNDGDGIPDDKDRCPNEPETKNGVDDDDGCPDTGGQVAIAAGKVEIPEQVQFETGKNTILPRSFALLDHIAAKLKETPTIKVRVEGHTDNQGTPEHNQALSLARANAVIDALVERGVERERLSATGYGATKPIASNRTASGRAKNRRVEFIIVEQ